uniref:Uncharacterized protein n=1 Tax=Anguilla anguilla TaxID=7936 RepID=A0A0E9QQ61_ANGAN
METLVSNWTLVAQQCCSISIQHDRQYSLIQNSKKDLEKHEVVVTG